MQCGGHLSSRAMMGHIAHSPLIHQVPRGSTEPRQGWPACRPSVRPPSRTLASSPLFHAARRSAAPRTAHWTETHFQSHAAPPPPSTFTNGPVKEAQGGVWQCHIPSPCSKNTPPPSKRHDLHSSNPFNICSFARTWNCIGYTLGKKTSTDKAKCSINYSPK